MLTVMAFAMFFELTMATFIGATIADFSHSWDCSECLEVDGVVPDGENTVVYRIHGPLFYNISQVLLNLFTQEAISEDPSDVILYLQECEIHNWSGQMALKTWYSRIESCRKTVDMSSMSNTRKTLMDTNSSLWYGVVFLDVEYMDEEALESLKKKVEGETDEAVQKDKQQGATTEVLNMEAGGSWIDANNGSR
jgi:MFS superfamily sulfate permease-like transporter